MTIEKRIKINDRYYFLGIELKYDDNGFLVKKDGSYFDMGDLGILIHDFEDSYDKSIVYDKNVGYMNDIIYLYDRFPFVSYIKDNVFDDEGRTAFGGCINKEEIIDYINKRNIELNRWDKDNCRCPLMYE
ncbi:MAG: hypothetical protein E7159_02210 [Firmicutes bacterium]|nr:hypothetical protein [Bacillota bacterium]